MNPTRHRDVPSIRTALCALQKLATIGACAIISCGALVTTPAAAPPAGAVPGDPLPGCQPHMLQDICDGPIRPDNTFKRCTMAHVGVGTLGGPAIPPANNCWMVDLNNNPNFGFGLPKKHID